MNILQITSAGICVSLLALCVKNLKSDMGQLITIGAVVLLTMAVIPYADKIIEAMEEFSQYSSLGRKYMTPILKITGTAYISQMGSQMCEDSGEKALAKRIEAAGKMLIAVMTLPVAKEAFVKIMGILS